MKFLEDLKKSGVELPTGMFDALVEDLRSQLLEETKMSLEAAKIEKARTLYEDLNGSMKDQLNGFRFSVPEVVPDFAVRDNVLFLEQAQGLTWSHLSEAERARVGSPIADSSLKLFFREGWFDPDRHGGNFIIDMDKKEIHPIDFGQAEEFSKLAAWKEDERYVFSEFLRALSAQDAAAVVKFGAKMTGQTAPSEVQLRAVRSEIEGIFHRFKGKPMSDQVIEIVNTFAGHRMKLDRKFSLMLQFLAPAAGR